VGVKAISNVSLDPRSIDHHSRKQRQFTGIKIQYEDTKVDTIREKTACLTDCAQDHNRHLAVSDMEAEREDRESAPVSSDGRGQFMQNSADMISDRAHLKAGAFGNLLAPEPWSDENQDPWPVRFCTTRWRHY
jgi:hypothetical protein